MAYAADSIDVATISNIALRDTNRLIGSVGKALAANSPWVGVMRGGVFKSGQGDSVLASIEMQAAPGDSFAEPTFIRDTTIAGTKGSDEKTGKITLDYVLESKRGRGPKVNVKQGYGAFKSSYLSAEDALRKLVTQYMNADSRAQIVRQSATKFTAKYGNGLDKNLGGGAEANRNLLWNWTNFALPDSPLTFKALHAVARYLKEALFGELFPAGDKAQQHFRFVGSQDILEAFRNETGVKEIMIALTTGGYKLGENTVSAYSFESSPAYRGIAFGNDQRPLRFNAIGDGVKKYNRNGAEDPAGVVVPDGIPAWIDPVTIVTDAPTNTAYAIANTAWLTATYEVGVLLADGAFERQVPEQYVGEGSFKFAPQLHMGELEWHFLKDNETNEFGDFGWHHFQISRAYKPLRPQWAIPLIYTRVQTDLGLVNPAP